MAGKMAKKKLKAKLEALVVTLPSTIPLKKKDITSKRDMPSIKGRGICLDFACKKRKMTKSLFVTLFFMMVLGNGFEAQIQTADLMG
jgi:hypothetical protein